MKNTAVLPLLALALSCAPKPDYETMVETSYNFNRAAVKPITSSDTTRAGYLVVEKNESTFIFINKSDFILKYSKNPNQIDMISAKGESFKWTEQRGYKISCKKIGDTLLVRFFPSKATPDSVFKFGLEYKFF